MLALREGLGHLMRIFYDWGFIEDGRTIEPISIGMVADDGRELYLVNEDAGAGTLHEQICRHQWLMENVVPHLPLYARRPGERHYGKSSTSTANTYKGFFSLDLNDNRVVSRRFMRNAIRDFLDASAPVELWGYFASYDHVLLAQMFGRMIDRPASMPMWTNDVQQVAAALGLDNSLPPQIGTAHNALDDARWTKAAWEYLTAKGEAGR